MKTKTKQPQLPRRLSYESVLLNADDARAAIGEIERVHGNLLFPNTPIQLEAHDHRVHFYTEGQWDSAEDRIVDGLKRVRELIKSHTLIWDSAVTRINPQWNDWREVQQASLVEALAQFAPPAGSDA